MSRDFVSVVSGVPRSGMSLMMQMLGAGGLPLLMDGLREPDADNPRGYFELEAVKRSRRDASWVADAVGCAVKVGHALVPTLPDGFDYRVVLMRRPLAQVVASQHAVLARLAAAGGIGGLADLAGGPSAAQLVEFFAAQLLDLTRWVEQRPRVRLLDVAADRAVHAPAEVAHQVAAFLGGGLDEAAMAAVVDPGLWHQRG
jgi:hypothetical protein